MINFHIKNIDKLKSDSKTSTFGARVEFLIEKKGISKLWLAEKLGITKQALNYLLKHSSKPKYIDSLAEIMNANPSWIESGLGSPFDLGSRHNTNSPSSRLEVHNSISVLSNIKGLETTSEKELIDYGNENVDHLIAYRIPNDSIFPPFMENSVLIFDKTKMPSNGDYVLIIINETESVLVRQYAKDGSDIYYRSTNDAYKSLVNVDAVIIGVLIEARYKLK